MEDASGASSFISDVADESATASSIDNANSGEHRPGERINVQNQDQAPTGGQQTSSPRDEFVAPAPLSFSVTKRNKLQKPPPTLSEPEESETQVVDKAKSSKDESTKKVTKAKPSSSSQPQPPLPYKEPEWGCIPNSDAYNFDVLKGGKIIHSVPLGHKSYHVFGRLPSCDVTLEHPTLSRYHAVMQFSNGEASSCGEKGWYIYDLDSTHGTWVNKRKIPANVYLKVKVGYVIKFGGSTRLHILQGPDDDQEEESELTFSEMKDQREKLKKEAELLQQTGMHAKMLQEAAEQKLLQDRGCSWGMGEDAVEEDGEQEALMTNLTAENEDLYIDDPKKALKGFYEREGCDLPDYQFTEAGIGKHKCVLNLPVDGPNGEELIAEAVVSGKRKDAVVACALEACRMLDKLGMLRASKHESRKRKQKKWEDNDYYDSDEDTFLDRTGTIEKKRAMRMKKAGKDAPETYESLMEKYNKVTQEIKESEAKLEKAKADEAKSQRGEDQDELEAYMSSIKAGAMDPKTRIRLKAELMRLRLEEQRLRRLVNIARPATLPPLKPSAVDVKTSPSVTSLAKKAHASPKPVGKTGSPAVQTQKFEEKPDNYEEEDEEEEEEIKVDQRTDKGLKDSKPSGKVIEGRPPAAERLKDQGDTSSVTAARPALMKGPALPPSMLAEMGKGKSAAEAFESAQKSMLTESSSEPMERDPD